MINKEILVGLIEKGNKVLLSIAPSSLGPTYVESNKLYPWKTQVLNYLEHEIGLNSQYYISFKEQVNNQYESSVKCGIEILNNLIEDFDTGINIGVIDKSEDIDDVLFRIFNRFHKCTRELRRRYNDRNTIDVKDEYDVQDVLRVLLKLYFEDIRPEEYTPSYAGSSSRVDFLLKKEKVVIEVKKTRPSLKAKELGNQLIEDIARYKSHPDCESLICFVYDPDGYITNPRGLENDLSTNEGFIIKVIIRPE